jgi:hypothetical protein
MERERECSSALASINERRINGNGQSELIRRLSRSSRTIKNSHGSSRTIVDIGSGLSSIRQHAWIESEIRFQPAF